MSYSKVRALTRVATPANEGDLLELALTDTTSHLERIVRAYRGALRDDEVDTANDLHDRRSVQWHHDDDGSFVLSARLTPEQGALVRQALEAATEAVDNGSAEPLSAGRESRGQRQADALVAMAESFLATGEHAGHSGDRHLVAVHVDAEVLADDAEGRCELQDGPALAAETARRLGCDAAVVGIVEDGRGTPLDVGRKTPSVPPAIRRALQVRDGGAASPGAPTAASSTATTFTTGLPVARPAWPTWCCCAAGITGAVHEGRYTAEATTDPHEPVRFRRPDGAVLAGRPRLPASDHRALATTTTGSASTSATSPPCPPGPANGSTSVSAWTPCSTRLSREPPNTAPPVGEAPAQRRGGKGELTNSRWCSHTTGRRGSCPSASSGRRTACSRGRRC